MYVCLEKRDADKARQEQTDVPGAGRGLRKAEKASDQIDERRRPTTDNHAALCSAQSMAAKTTVMRMIIKNALCHGWRSSGGSSSSGRERERIISVDHHNRYHQPTPQPQPQPLRLCLLVS
jgi:hypothetical protein